MATFEVLRANVVTAFPRHEAQITADTIAWLEAESGVGMARVKRESQQGPLQHGSTDLGFRLEPRFLSLIFGIQGLDLGDVATKRDALTEIFAPADAPIRCRWTLDNGAVRQIDCHFADDLDFASSARIGVYQRTAVRLKADDPTFYDPAGVSVSFGIAASGDAFNVPLAIPWAIGSSTVDQEVSVNYAGTWRSSPTVTIIGPINNPIVRNLTTGEKLDFTGVILGAGDSYVIDTRYGIATVIDAGGVDRTANLSDDSDLTTFHLASRSDVPGGVNDLQVTGSAATAATQVYVQFLTRYLSL